MNSGSGSTDAVPGQFAEASNIAEGRISAGPNRRRRTGLSQLAARVATALLATTLIGVSPVGPGLPAADAASLVTDQVLTNTEGQVRKGLGTVMAREGNTLAITVPDGTGSPTVRIYLRNGASDPWVLSEGLANNRQGWGRSLAIRGTSLAVGSDDAIHWFVQDSAGSFNNVPGSPLVRDGEDFGAAVAFDVFGTLLVGAPQAVSGTVTSTTTGVVYPVINGANGPQIDFGANLVAPDQSADEGDLFGVSIQTTFETDSSGQVISHVWVGAPGDDSAATDGGAIYRFSNPFNEGYVINTKINEFGSDDMAGYAFAVDRQNPDNVVVGVEAAGKALLFVQGTQAGFIDITDRSAPVDSRGWLAYDGGLIAVGLPNPSSNSGGEVRLYDFDNSGSSLDSPIHSFTPPDTNGDDEVGATVLIDDLDLIAGAPGFDNPEVANGSDAGQVYNVPIEDRPSPPSINLPIGLDVDGGWAAIGDPDNDVVHIASFDGSAWTNEAQLDGPPGTGFGAAVAMDGPVLAIGSPLENNGMGNVRIFVRDQADDFTPVDEVGSAALGGLIGASIDVKDRLVVAGMPDSFFDTGAVLVMKLATDYTIQSLDEVRSANPDEGFFGSGVAIVNEERFWVGSQFFGPNDDGRVSLWDLTGNGWAENGGYELLGPASADQGIFGASLAADGPRLVVGAPTEGGSDGRAFYYPNPFVDISDVEVFSDTVGGSESFGGDVAISGDMVVFGSSGPIGGMSVYSDLEFGNELDFVQRIPGTAGNPTSVAADGPHQVLSITPADGTISSFTEGTVRDRLLNGSAGAPGQKVVSTVGSEDDGFGRSVAVDGETMAVLSPAAKTANPVPGAIEIFGYEEGSWEPIQVLASPIGANAVALGGNQLAVLGDESLAIYSRSGPGSTFGSPSATSLFNQGRFLDMTDDWVAAGDGLTIRLFARNGATVTEDPASPMTAAHDDLAIDGDIMAISSVGGPYNSGTSTIYSLSPTVAEVQDVSDGSESFGRSVDLWDGKMAVGGTDSVTVYRDLLTPPATVEASLTSGESLSNFGFNLELGPDRLVVAQRADLEFDPADLRLESGLAFFGFDGADWLPTGTYVQPNQAQNFSSSGVNDDRFGVALSAGAGRVAAGAPLEDEAGEDAGAVFVVDIPDPPAPSTPTALTVTVEPATATVPVGATAVATANLAPQSTAGAGSGSQGIADVSLGTAAAEEGGDNAILAETTVGELNLSADLLDTILLSDVPIEGGWGPVLAGSPLANQPIQSVTLGDVVDAGLIDDLDLNRLDLSSTPIGAVPIGAVSIADTPIGAVELPSGQTVCELAEDLLPGFNCLDDFSLIDLGIRGVPIGAVPIGAVPIGAVDITGTPIGAVPIGAVDITGTPIGAVPIGAVDLAQTPIGAVPIGAVPIGAVPIGAVPIGAVVLATTPIGAVTIGDLNTAGIQGSPIGAVPIGAVPIGAVPIGAVPIGAVELSSIPIGAVPIGAVDIDGTPIGAVPIGAVDLQSSPIGAVPIGAVDINGAPIEDVPIDVIALGSIPIGAVPIDTLTVGTVAIDSIDLDSSPVGAVPISAVPDGQISSLVDCALIDCPGPATLADAAAAGALLSTANLGLFAGADTGLRMADLIDIIGFTEPQLRAQVDGLAPFTLANFLTFDDLTLGELPQTDPNVTTTTLAELGADFLALISLQDLLDGLEGLTEADIRAQLTAAGVLTIAQLANRNGMVLADLITDPIDPTLATVTIEQLLPFMAGIRLGDLLDIYSGLTAEDIDWGDTVMEDVTDWEDVTLEELAEFAGTTLEELLANLDQATLDTLTLGDILLSLLGIESYDWAEIDLRSLDLPPSAPVTINTTFSVAGANANVRLQVLLPPGSVYIEDSAAVAVPAGASTPTGLDDPSISDNVVEFLLGNVDPDAEYVVSVETGAGLKLGTRTIGARGRVAGTAIEAEENGSVTVVEAFEPNNTVADATPAETDTVYVSHLSAADDVDLFKIDLDEGARLALSLSDLPRDYDLAVFGPVEEPLIPLGEQEITPTVPPTRVGFAGSENSNKPGSLADLPRQGDLPLISVSNKPDTETEIIDIAKVRRAGTYYIQVSGHSGAFSASPYGLFVNVVPPPPPLVCVSQDYSSPADQGSLPSAAEMAGVNTLILTNQERLFAKHGADASTAVTAMNDLVTYLDANPALGLKAAIVAVDGDADIRAAYAALDADACRPTVVNDTVREIGALLGELRNADPATEIDNIIIVGDDDVIPFARLEDDTTIANETSFAWTFQGGDANTLFGLASGGYYQSDEPYGDLDPIRSGKRTLFVTDTALGRLVETPGEIAGQIATYIAFGGVLNPDTGFVSGYDFLSDGAQSVTDELDALPDINPVGSLISETWTKSDLDGGLFPAGDSPTVAAINAHFDQYRAQPADQSAAGSETELFTTADVDRADRVDELLGRILFSMGCHGGLHVPDELFPTDDARALDWAQTFSRQRAVWVGNSGYGYGETEGVELSERLMALFAANLDGSISVGEALLYAKQSYVGTRQAEYGPFDEKVLQQSTFYGLPIYRIGVATPPPATPIPDLPGLFPLSETSLSVSTIISAPTFQRIENEGGTTFEAELPSTDDGVTRQQTTPFAPILPVVSYDVSAVSEDGSAPVAVAQGAFITALRTTDVENVEPDFAKPIVDLAANETEPELSEVGTEPTVFISNYRTPEGPRQQLSALAATFRSTSPDGRGTMRLFQNVGFEVFYRDAGSGADQRAPIYSAIESQVLTAGDTSVLVISARVADPSGVERVQALVAQDPGADTTWTAVELTQQGPLLWSGSLELTGSQAEFLVQAVDGNGNVAISTNKAASYTDSDEPDAASGSIDAGPDRQPDNGVYYTSAVSVSATAAGQELEYRLDNGPLVPGGAEPSVNLDPDELGDGAHTVTFVLPDGDEQSVTVLFDTQGPIIALSPSDGSQVQAPVTVRFSCGDAASGTETCTGSVDGQAVADGDVIALPAGQHRLVVAAADSLGNSTGATAGFTVVADPDDPDDPECTITGTDRNDVLRGTHGPDVICGFGGNDRLYGMGGDDILLGGDGNDKMFGGAGDDTLYGEAGKDQVNGESGDDELHGGDGRDWVSGGSGDDRIWGDAERDRLSGGSGNDRIRGGAGDDLINASDGDDVVEGEDGDDKINLGDGDDVADGGPGDDFLNGDDGHDQLSGGPDDDRILGGAGNDIIGGNEGDDQLFGRAGDDAIDGGPGTDRCRGESGNNTEVNCEL